MYFSRILSLGETIDGLGVKYCTTDQIVFSALVILVSEILCAKLWQYLNTSISTAYFRRQRFWYAFAKQLKCQWIRDPNESELKQISKEYIKLGFLGCVSCLYCAS